MQETWVPEEYKKVFDDSLSDVKHFLKGGAMGAFSQEWGAGYAVVPLGSRDIARRFGKPDPWPEFCRYVRETLEREDLCIRCDERRAQEAAELGGPKDYWCDWGLRDIAVPIMLHGFSVGTTFLRAEEARM